MRAGGVNQAASVSRAAVRGLPALPNLGHDFLARQVQNLALASAERLAKPTAWTRIFMGAFYGNITLKAESQAAVVEALRGRRAIVTPKIGDYIVAFDSICDEQDVDGIQALTSRLSRELLCAALAVIVHDDDVFAYFLYQEGVLIDWYNSSPSYFNFGSADEPAAPSGGSAKCLCETFGVRRPEQIDQILRQRPGKTGYVFETDRHRDLVSSLSLPKCSVGVAFASFEDNNHLVGLSPGSMVRAVDPPPLEDPQLKSDRQFYEQLGPEDLSRSCKKEGC